MKNMQVVMSASLLTLLLLNGNAANQANEVASDNVSTNTPNTAVDNAAHEPGDK